MISSATSTAVVHIPHASAVIPDDVRGQFVLSAADLSTELAVLTDWYTDDLFGGAIEGAEDVIYAVSRLVVDPERFPDDEQEPAARVGMGVVYSRTSSGAPLRRPMEGTARAALLERFYWPHHQRLADAVQRALASSGKCLLFDCHSFPFASLPTEESRVRPEICIGTDPAHTPRELAEAATEAFRAEGFSVLVDRPFAGVLVPRPFYRRDARVWALMVEVARWIYMDEDRVAKRETFDDVQARIARAMQSLADLPMTARPPIGRGGHSTDSTPTSV